MSCSTSYYLHISWPLVTSWVWCHRRSLYSPDGTIEHFVYITVVLQKHWFFLNCLTFVQNSEVWDICSLFCIKIVRNLIVIHGLHSYSCVLVNCKTSTGGGIALFIINNLTIDICADLNAFAYDNFECVFVNLSSSTFKTKILGSVYQPPNSNLHLLNCLCWALNLS